MKTSLKLVVLILFIFACFPGSGAAAESSRPNIVIILLDDMGFSDIVDVNCILQHALVEAR